MSTPTHLKKEYAEQFAVLDPLCAAFNIAFSDGNEEAMLLLVGGIVAVCARIYNLAPKAGIIDPATLFTGKVDE